jgi:hypothetical protein
MFIDFVPADNQPVNGFTLIRVGSSAKVRFRGGPLQANREYYPDDWILWRSAVPNLTDAEWFAVPTGWKINSIGSSGAEEL